MNDANSWPMNRNLRLCLLIAVAGLLVLGWGFRPRGGGNRTSAPNPRDAAPPREAASGAQNDEGTAGSPRVVSVTDTKERLNAWARALKSAKSASESRELLRQIRGYLLS